MKCSSWESIVGVRPPPVATVNTYAVLWMAWHKINIIMLASWQCYGIVLPRHMYIDWFMIQFSRYYAASLPEYGSTY